MNAKLVNYVEIRPDRRGRQRAYVAGTRVRVADVYLHHERRGASPEEVVAAYPQLSLSAVYAALSYCFDHLAEIRADLQADTEWAAAMQKQIGPGPLSRKLDGNGNAVSPVQ